MDKEQVLEIWRSGHGGATLADGILAFAAAIESEVVKGAEPVGTVEVIDGCSYTNWTRLPHNGKHLLYASPQPCPKCAEFANEVRVQYLRAEAAEAERDALRVDAERYRWLKESAAYPSYVWDALANQKQQDAAIDAAIKKDGWNEAISIALKERK